MVISLLDKIKICVQHIISADLIFNVKLDGRRLPYNLISFPGRTTFVEVRKTYLVHKSQSRYGNHTSHHSTYIFNNMVISLLDKIKICVQHIISADLISNVKLDGRRAAIQSYIVPEQDNIRRGTENVHRALKSIEIRKTYLAHVKINRGTETVPRSR